MNQPPDAPINSSQETDVYAIHGADPEVLAYAMAKYSRSSLTLRESLREISAQKAEQFLNTFYFAYGHRSIADLAHIPMAVERLSLLAAIALVDEQRWDGQERSTRYQDFRRSGWFTPSLGESTGRYTETIQSLFAAYDQVSQGMLAAFKASIPCPPEMKPDAYDRALKARAFDVARYLLPLATNTSLGQITNARTLETQVSRLLTSEFAEIRTLGTRLREAALTPAWNPDPAAPPVKAAPTLVKYAVANDYQRETRALLTQAAAELMSGVPIAPAPVVDLVEPEPLVVEIATSLLYPHSHHSYRQLSAQLTSSSPSKVTEIIELGTRNRGRHDELHRSFNSGQTLRFDILMDVGGFRDMHRHRRCTQLLQPFTNLHGYELPAAPGQPTLEQAGLAEIYKNAMKTASAAFTELSNSGAQEALQSATYCLPLATRCRSVFKMDLAQAIYIADLRSGPGGHWSYRRVAWEMFTAIQNRYPELASLFRTTDVNIPIDMLQR